MRDKLKFNSRDEALIHEAKTLARLQIRRKALSKDLREINRQIRVTQGNLRRLTTEDQAPREWTETGARLKILGGD